MKKKSEEIYLIWNNEKKKKKLIVGTLVKEKKYRFYYSHQILRAITEGFEPLLSFPCIYKEYESDVVFPVFSSRLPDKKRKGIDKILKKYNIEEYNEFEMLKKGGAKLPIDDIEFMKSP